MSNTFGISKTANALIKLVLLVILFGSFSLIIGIPTNFGAQTNSIAIESLAIVQWLPMSVYLTAFFVSGIIAAYYVKSSVMNLTLVCLFSSVILGFWMLKSPLGLYESVSKLANMEVILQTGHLTATEGNYLSWPALFLLGSAFSEVSGISLYLFQISFLVAYACILGLTLYALMVRILGSSFYAFVATVSILVGNLNLTSYYFHPDLMAVLLVVAIILNQTIGGGNSIRSLATNMILGVGLVLESFTGAIIILFFLLFVTATGSFRRKGSHVGMLVLYGCVLIVWMVFWGAQSASNTISFALSSLSNLFAGVSHVHSLYLANLQEPIWAVVVRLTWIFALIVLPLFLILKHILQKSNVDAVTDWLVFASIATAILSLLNNGTNFFALLLYGPIAGVPIILLTLGRKKLAIIFVVFLVAMAVPTFFIDGSRVGGGHVSFQQYDSAIYLDSFDGSLTVFNASPYVALFRPNLPTAGVPILFGGGPQSDITPNQVRQYLIKVYDDFLQGNGILQFANSNLENVFHLYGTMIGTQVQAAVHSACQNHSLIFNTGQYVICSS